MVRSQHAHYDDMFMLYSQGSPYFSKILSNYIGLFLDNLFGKLP